jgi:HPr serine kinase-like protein
MAKKHTGTNVGAPIEKEGGIEVKLSTRRDPLNYEAAFPFAKTYFPIGLTLHLATNSKEVLAAADESWGGFQKSLSLPPLQMRIGVLSEPSHMCPNPPRTTGQEDMILRVADDQNFSVSNTTTGFSFGWVNDAVVANRAYFRYYFLEGSFWMMAVPMYFTPIHGACVNYRGAGVLLCGDSGVGKSSLSYACARSGWAFLCDDSSHLVRSRTGRIVIGNPYQVRFRPSATELFPELATQRVAPRITGKLSIELVTADFPQITRIHESSVDFIVFLNRRRGPAELVPVKKSSAIRWFEQEICYASPAIRAAQRESLRNLLGAEIFELRYSDFEGAIARLESMVQSGSTMAKEILSTAARELNA